MLTQTLRKLERDGLVSRKVTPSTPPRVDYAITALGQSLFEPIGAMAQWAIDKQPDILKARDQFDRQH
jgi:DNA-binding HxlR family transcriptional regulator